MTVGSLFSGIGGIDLGLERAGMSVRWQCEIEPRLRAVLRHHWPDLPCYEDACRLGAVERVDVVAGGFPCQPVSQAAARTSRGDGWLWPAMARVVERVRPRFVLVENPEGLRYAGRGLGEVLDDLSRFGYDAEWRVVRASEVGAPHHRARVWLVAHSDRDWQPALTVDDEASGLPESPSSLSEWAAVPDVRVDDGIPERVAISAFGNAVVPRVAEWIGRRLMAAASNQDRDPAKRPPVLDITESS